MPPDRTQPSLTARVRENLPYAVGGRLVSPLFRLAVTVYAMRVLSVADYGIWNVLTAIKGYVAMVSSLGVPSLSQRFIPEFQEKGQFDNVRRLLGAGCALRLAVSSALVLGIFAASGPLGARLGIDGFGAYFALFSLSVVFGLQAELLTAMLGALFLQRCVQVAGLAAIALRAGIIFALLAGGQGVAGVLLAESAYCAILFAAYGVAALRFSDRQPRGDGTPFPWARARRYGLMSYLNEAGATLFDVQTDFLVIGAFLGPGPVGLYAFANRLVMSLVMLLPHNLLLELIRPAFFSRYARDGDRASLQRMFTLLSKLAALFLLPLTAGLIAVGDKIVVFLFGAKYVDSLPVLIVVAVFVSLNAFMTTTSFVLQALERADILLAAKAFAVLNLVLDVLVVRPWGILGVALATCASVLLRTAFCYFAARREAGLRLDRVGLLRLAAAAALVGACLACGRPWITGVWSLAVAIALAGALFVGLLFAVRPFTDAERAMVNGVVGRRVLVF